MPLFKIDYDAKLLSQSQIQELVKVILESSKNIFKTVDDKISIFTDKYDEVDFSTAVAEIECRARLAEFEHPKLSKNEVREKFLADYRAQLGKFISDNKLTKGVVFTITFEDWQVVWMPPSEN